MAWPQLVGTPITWTASATDTNAGALDYQFSVSEGTGAYQILQDYDISNVFVWTETAHEGHYFVQVIARNLTTNETQSLSIPYAIAPVATGSTPVISTTANPLVALYSTPPCPQGSSMYVSFGVTGTAPFQTNTLACSGNFTMNFYVAGMLPGTTYNMNYVLVTGSNSTAGPVSSFTTGKIAAGMEFPAISVLLPSNSETSLTQTVLLLDPFNNPNRTYIPTAVNLKGQVIWYYPGLAQPDQENAYFIRPLSSATMLMYLNNPSGAVVKQQIFREIDFAGNTVRQTDVTRVNQQLASMGVLGITGFNHDAWRLSNGNTLVKGTQEELFPPGTQGSTTGDPVDVLGDAIMELDTNMQVIWYWSAFDYLDINHPSPLGETCTPNDPDCPPMSLAPVANDWTHMNSLFYIPSTGDLLVSLRDLDWVLKIDFNNGAGTGDIIWTLGMGGNFNIESSDPYPWFSHQHDVAYQLNGTQILSLFDNGNTRIAENPGGVSRGQVLSIDESAFTATLELNVNMSGFSPAVGSAQRLNNGDYHFEAGWLNPGADVYAQAVEVLPNGGYNFELQDNSSTYRGYRMDSLYELDAPGN